MFLYKCEIDSQTIFTLLDKNEKVVIYPTYYLAHLRIQNRSFQSQKHIAYILKQFCQWIESFKEFTCVSIDLFIKSTTLEDIFDWINYQRHSGASESTIHNREVLLKGFFTWLTSESAGRARNDVPWKSTFITKKAHTPLPRFVVTEQVISLLNGVYNESQRAALHFMFDTGLRVSELVRITNESLPKEKDWVDDLNYYPLIVPGSKSYNGNKYKYRFTIISKAVLSRVRKYHSSLTYLLAKDWSISDKNKPIFLNVRGLPLTVSAVQKLITTTLIRLNRDSKEISPHRLRHGTAYSVLRSELGNDILDRLLILKNMFGHESISTTEMYTSIPITALRSLADKQEIRTKYEDAQRIYESTYLPERLHKEKRGHKS